MGLLYAKAQLSIAPWLNPNTLKSNELRLYLLTNKKLKNKDKIYIPNGSIYYTKINYLKKVKTFVSKNCDIYLMDDFCSVDIDTQDEWNIAEACLNKVLFSKDKQFNYTI